ncbi:MAG: molybdopterin-dependent oxidoreductase, partial [Solirubrobacteraceae bacterium]
VVHTQTERVRGAQQAMVEFLLVNHPLDCPVCDKGGECPLQDISYGWGAGRSRFIEPKRHFTKPLELSPLVAIDRERCILCYRCVRFSQEVAEDYQLVLLERGANSYVATFDGHPYVAPFSGNIIELCPVGALTSRSYRFRARPWEIENSGSVCTLCPSQCNVTFTVRDERVLRVLAREHDDVDDGWLCDKGRFAYQSIHVDERITQPLVRDGGELRPVSWERALEAAGAIGKHAGRVGAIVGGQTTNEEAFLLSRMLREKLESGDIDCRPGSSLGLEDTKALAAPGLQATVPDLEYAHTVLVLDCDPIDDAPILDLRIRKGVRRRGVKLAVATSRPTALDPSAQAIVRFAPGAGEAFLAALDAALTGSDFSQLAVAAGAAQDEIRELAALLTDTGEDVVVLWGERLTGGARGPQAARALLNVTSRLKLADKDGAGLLEVPAGTNGRGLREAGALPHAGPGYTAAEAAGRDAQVIAKAAADGEITALYLLHADPLRSHPDRALWEAALGKAAVVVVHDSTMTDTIRDHATVVFPSDSYAEKEGTVVHPDGRVQRLRPAIGRPHEVRADWQVIADVSARIGHDLGVLTGSMASQQLFDAVPFYAGLTLEELGGRGVRWPEREQAAALSTTTGDPTDLEAPLAAATPNGSLRLGTFRSIWASPEVELSPALQFLSASQRVEISPDDAGRLGLAQGDRVDVGSNGTRVRGTIALRQNTPAGTVFLEEGLAQESASVLTENLVEVRKA